MPVTTPEVLTVAMRLLLLLHTPPVVAFFNAAVLLAQKLVVPVIAATTGMATTLMPAETFDAHPLLLMSV